MRSFLMLMGLLLAVNASAHQDPSRSDGHQNWPENREDNRRGHRHDHPRREEPSRNRQEGRNTCTIIGERSSSALNYNFYWDNTDINAANLLMIMTGSRVEILGYETVYYNGQARDGVAFRLIQNNTSECGYNSCVELAQEGEVYYMYANLFYCE